MSSFAGSGGRVRVRRHMSRIGPRWLRKGGAYWSFIAIRSIPYNLPDDFLQSIMQRFPYSAASVSVCRVSRENSISRLDRAATRYGAELTYRLETGKQTGSLTDIHSRVTDLRNAVASDDASLIDVSAVLSITGFSVEETETRMKALEAELRATGVGVYSGRYIQRRLAEMFSANTPPRFPFVVSITEHSLLAFMPFTQTPLIQQSGTLLGTDTADGSQVILNRFGGANFNTIIMGKSGSGKSYFAKLMILREASNPGSSYFILDPLGEFVQIALFLRGVHRSVATEGLGTGNVPVSHSTVIVNGAFELICSAVQLSGQDTVTVRDLFFRHASLNPGASIAQTLSAVSDKLTEDRSADISSRLKRVVSGDLSFILSGETPKPAKGGVTVFDYSLIDSELKTAVARFLLETVFETCKYEDGRKTIIIDEAWRFSDDDRLRSTLSQAMRHSRHYNLAVMLLTQNVSDITGSSFADGILNNTDSCFIFRHEDGTSALPEDYRLMPDEKDFVNSFTPRDARKSRCVMIAAGRKVKLEIESSSDEFDLCNSEAPVGRSTFQFICSLADRKLDKIEAMLAEAY